MKKNIINYNEKECLYFKQIFKIEKNIIDFNNVYNIINNKTISSDFLLYIKKFFKYKKKNKYNDILF